MPELGTDELVVRVLLAAALGGVIGLEREYADQPAGFRTHILVSLGAALFTLLGAYGAGAFSGVAEVRFDPTRVAAQVVTGIGFLGAGAIIQQGVNIRGLTTAASLWVTAAIGTAVGIGFVAGAVATTVAGLVALMLLKWVEHTALARVKRGRTKFVVDADATFRFTELNQVVELHGGRVDSMKVTEDGERLIAIVRLQAGSSGDVIAADLRRLEGVRNVDVSP